MRRGPFAFLLGICSCGGGGASTPDGQPHVGDPDATVAEQQPDGWRSLITSSWTLAPGTERYRCARRTLGADATIRAFRPTAPLGTHHTILSLTDGSAPDGDYDCGPIAGERAIYMSGVGSPGFELPPGVAVRLRSGQQIVLNLHLYNTDPDRPLTGVSGVEMETVTDATAMSEAEIVLAGPLGFTIGTGHQERTFQCTINSPVTLFAIGPHMHRLGSGMRVTWGKDVLLDVPYSFDEQHFHRVGPITLDAGQRLLVTCIWENDTGGTVRFGDSSDDEMCFAVLYRYPVVPGATFCIQ